MEGVFGEHHKVHGRHVAPRLADHVDDPPGLARQVLGCCHYRKLKLDEADDDAVRGLVQSTETAHALTLFTW